MAVFNAQLIRMVEQNLYALKRQYGGPVIFCSLLDADTDYHTGCKVVRYRAWPLNNAIVLPSRMSRDVVASVARISSNKPLAYGGEFNVGDRGFILDGGDLPADCEVKKDDWLLYRGERYGVKTIRRVCGNIGWIVVARKHPGMPLTVHVTAHSAVDVRGEASR